MVVHKSTVTELGEQVDQFGSKKRVTLNSTFSGSCRLFETGVYSGSGVISEKKLLRVLKMSNFLSFTCIMNNIK